MVSLNYCGTLQLGLILDENGIDIDGGLAGKTGVKMLGAFNQSVETFINLRNSMTDNGINKKTVQVKGGQNIMADKIEINTGGQQWQRHRMIDGYYKHDVVLKTGVAYLVKV